MTKNLRLDRETLSLFPLSQLKIQSYRVSMLYLKISLCQIYLAISSLVRVSMWCPASKTICGEVDVWSLLHLDLKKTNSWNREVARSSSCCSLQQVYPPGNARKFTYLGRWDELGETEGGWEGQSPNCHHSSHSGLVLLLSSLSLLLSILLFLPRYGVISCKALLSRCGNFIFAMNLHSPSPCSSSILLSTRPLSSVLCPVTLHLRVRARVVLVSRLFSLSEVHAKRAVSFTSSSSFDRVLSMSEERACRFTEDTLCQRCFVFTSNSLIKVSLSECHCWTLMERLQLRWTFIYK